MEAQSAAVLEVAEAREQAQRDTAAAIAAADNRAQLIKLEA